MELKCLSEHFLISPTWVGTLELNFRYMPNKGRIVRAHHTNHETGLGLILLLGFSSSG